MTENKKLKIIAALICILFAALIGFNNLNKFKPRNFVQTGEMYYGRRLDHTATLLNEGRVLIAGGVISTKDTELYDETPTTELYDPETGNFSPGPDMHEKRALHTATLLKDGRVLITGGGNYKYVKDNITFKSAEIYDPKTNKFTLTPNMHYKRKEHISAMLNDGRVLIVGGVYELPYYKIELPYKVTPSEIYDPETNSFTLTGRTNYERELSSQYINVGTTPVLLKNGNVLLAGIGEERTMGKKWFKKLKLNPMDTTRSEIYSPKTSEFTPVDELKIDVYGALLLKDGKVFIQGKQIPYFDYERDTMRIHILKPEIFIYNPETKKIEKTIKIPELFEKLILLKDGNVLLTKKENMYKDMEVSVFDTSQNEIIPICAEDTQSSGDQATLLKDGNVLFTGGNHNYPFNKQAEVFIYKGVKRDNKQK